MSRARMFWATIMILVVFSACAEEQFDPEEDFAFEIIDDGNAVKITGYVGTNTEVRIPRRILGNSVTHIGDVAFAGNQLTNIVIPGSVTHIGDGAFWDNQLANIVIPGSVTHIGDWAFWDNQLTNIVIGNGVTHI